MALELAAAYVSLTVSARGLLDKVKAELGAPLETAARTAGDRAGGQLGRGLTASAKAAGKKAGQDLADGVNGGVAAAAAGFGAPLVQAAKAAGGRAGDLLDVELVAAAKATGTKAGEALARGVDGGLDSVVLGDNLAGPLVVAARKAGDRAGDALSDGLERTAKDTGRKLGRNLDDGVAEGLKDVGKKLAAAFAAVQVGSFLKGAITAAADTAESVSKLNVLVGDSAEELDDWSTTTAEAFGISRRAALSAAGTFATFFRGVGKSQEEAAGMSRELTELAADLASFSNTSPEQAIEALGAALRGESEPIRAYGVLLDDATLKTRAFNLGLVATTKEALTPAIRVQAAYAEILAQTGNAQGDFARTSDGLAGSQKQLAAEFKDAQASLGEALLPAMSAAVGVAKDLLPAVSGLAENFAGVAAAAGQAVGPVGSLLGSFLQSDIGSAAVAFGTVGLTLGNVVIPAVVKAKDAFDKLADAQLAASGAAGLAFAAVAAVGFSIYSAVRKDAADAAEASESLGKALTDAQDPLVTSREHADDLAAAFGRLAVSTGKAEESTVELDAAWAQQTIIDRGSIDLFNKAGIGIDRIALAMRQGKDSFHSFHADLDDSIRAGRISRDEYAKLADEVEFLGDAYQDQADKTNEANEAAIAAALNSGVLTQAQVDAARATKEVDQETRRYKTAYELLLPVLDAAAKAAEDNASKNGDLAAAVGPAARSMDDLATAAAGSVGGQENAAEAAERIAEAQGLAEDAAKKHRDALKDLTDGISDFVDKSGSGRKNADEWAKSLYDLAKAVSGQRLDVELSDSEKDKRAAFEFMKLQGASSEALAAARVNLGLASEADQEAFDTMVTSAQAEVDALIKTGAPLEEIGARAIALANELHTHAAAVGIQLRDNIASLEGNSQAALANRDLFEGFLRQAKEDINELVNRPGTSIEDVTARANELAAQVGATGAAMGLSGPALDEYVARIRGIGATAVDANKQLQALPTQLAIDIEATMRLNLDEFRVGLEIASREFQDEMSRAVVASGIIEIPGASFALPARAQGGPVRAGEMYWVGEHGPEPFIPDVNGTVIANDKVSVLAGAGGGVQIGAVNITEAQSAEHVFEEFKTRVGWELTTRNER